MSDVNGADPGQQPLGKDQLDVVKELEGLLAEAKAGRIASFGMVVISGPGNLNIRGTMTHMLEIYFGADALKDMVKAVMMQKASRQPYAQSRILRPGNLPAGAMPPGVG